MQRILLFGSLLLGLLLAAPLAGATVLGAGASGQCYDRAGNGGHDEVRVGLDSDDPTSPSVTVLTVTGAIGGLAQFAMGIVANGGDLEQDACPNQGTLDYIEVDARVDDTYVQVCYDGDVRTDGGCPTSPGGPGGA